MTRRDPHLAPEELVEFVDGALEQARVDHLGTCSACRARAEALTGDRGEVSGIEVPEPDPGFWNDLSARISRRIAAEPAHGGAVRRILQPTPARWAALAAAACLVIVMAAWRSGSTASPSSTTPGSGLAAGRESPAGTDILGDIDADAAWAVVRLVADDAEQGDIDGAGVVTRPGSVDGLTYGMSDRERLELARLLEEEMKRPALADASS
jgi:hypothetical protein